MLDILYYMFCHDFRLPFDKLRAGYRKSRQNGSCVFLYLGLTPEAINISLLTELIIMLLCVESSTWMFHVFIILFTLWNLKTIPQGESDILFFMFCHDFRLRHRKSRQNGSWVFLYLGLTPEAINISLLTELIIMLLCVESST